MSTAVHPPGSEADIEATLTSTGTEFTEDANAEETRVASAPATEVAEPTETEQPLEESPESTDSAVEASEDGEQVTDETESEPSAYSLLLPRKQLKDYPEELYQLAAKALQIPPEKLEEPYVKNILKAKIDADIREQQFSERQAEEAGEETGEGEEDAESETATAAEPPKPLTAAEQVKLAEQYAESVVTPEGAALYAQSQSTAWKELMDAQDSGDEKAIAAASEKVTRSQVAFAVPLITRIVKEMLPQVLPMMPKEVWQQGVGTVLNEQGEVRKTHDSARELIFKDAKYGPEAKTLVESGKVLEFLTANPEITEKQFFDPATGKKLGRVANVAAQYRFAIDHLRGQNFTRPVKLAADAAKAGAKQATDQARNRSLSRLAPGRSTGAIQRKGAGDQGYIQRMKEQSEVDSPLSGFSGR